MKSVSLKDIVSTGICLLGVENSELQGMNVTYVEVELLCDRKKKRYQQSFQGAPRVKQCRRELRGYLDVS